MQTALYAPSRSIDLGDGRTMVVEPYNFDAPQPMAVRPHDAAEHHGHMLALAFDAHGELDRRDITPARGRELRSIIAVAERHAMLTEWEPVAA